ncbi:Imidazole glycerol phosphate synthase hisHF [Nymphaea thermarum]|nr:Imidazole glycerol phosphate synthase hisHF [Nymphaea thermarum]
MSIAFGRLVMERIVHLGHELAKAVEELGAGEILLNCIDCNGQDQGFDIGLVKVQRNLALARVGSTKTRCSLVVATMGWPARLRLRLLGQLVRSGQARPRPRLADRGSAMAYTLWASLDGVSDLLGMAWLWPTLTELSELG